MNNLGFNNANSNNLSASNPSANNLSINILQTPVYGFSDGEMALRQMLKIKQDIERESMHRENALLASNKAHHEVLIRLAIAAEYRDNDTGSHIIRLGYMAEKLSALLGESDVFCFLIRLAAPMHDVGKIGVPDSLLNAAGESNAEDIPMLQAHAEIGYKILANSNIALFQLAATIALNHHEKLDGSGYPNKLLGKNIPLAGRIVSIIDCFDALTTDKSDRKAFSDNVAVEMMLEKRGSYFDPEILDVFVEHINDFIELRQKINSIKIEYSQLMNFSLHEIMQPTPLQTKV